MKYEVTLKLHQDDATGEWGLCHANTIGKFNAFWSPDGIFHDVFEHYFEDNHKYFSGNAAFTIWGEMCASGHGIAYADIGINSFRYRTYSLNRNFCADTSGILENWLYEVAQEIEDRANAIAYGPEFTIEHCKIPYQKDPGQYNLYNWVSAYEYLIKNTWLEYPVEAVKRIKTANMRNAYRYGFKQAKKIIGNDVKHSYTVLDEFLTIWNSITKHKTDELWLWSDNLNEDNERLSIDSGIYGFKFIVENTGQLKVTTTVLDDFKNEYPLTNLSIY